MNRPIYCGCGYKLIYSKEVRPDMLTDLPQCSNPVHPARPLCPECDNRGPHRMLLANHMLCRQCGHSFDPRKDQG